MPLFARYPREQIESGRHDVLPSAPDAEQFVREAAIGDGWLHPDASNYTFVVELELDGRQAHGVYKPRSGEAPLWDFPIGTLHHRECAAYELGKALGWGLIPPTVEREGEAGEGSLQLFVSHGPDSNFFTFRDGREEECLRLAVFDLIANNADRKGGHCFIGPDDRVWAVDNGLTFNAAHKLRTVIWDFAGSPVPDPPAGGRRPRGRRPCVRRWPAGAGARRQTRRTGGGSAARPPAPPAGRPHAPHAQHPPRPALPLAVVVPVVPAKAGTSQRSCC